MAVNDCFCGVSDHDPAIPRGRRVFLRQRYAEGGPGDVQVVHHGFKHSHSAGGDDDTRKVAFDEGATVTIKLAGRDLDALSSSHEYVALWATDAVPDSSVTFVLDDAIANKFHLKRDNTGLKVRKNVGSRIIIR